MLAEVPRSISIPAFSVGEPVTLLFKTIVLSSTVKVSVFKIVCVPSTVKLPEIVTLLVIDKPLKVGLSEVPKPNDVLAVAPDSIV